MSTRTHSTCTTRQLDTLPPPCAIPFHYVIPQLVDFNFSRGGYPKLRVRRIGEEEALRTTSFAVRNFVGANIIRPDDKLEKFIRSELDLPLADPDTVRLPPTPQAGGGNTAGTPGAPKAPE